MGRFAVTHSGARLDPELLEDGCRRLREVVLDACAAEEDLPRILEASVGAAFRLLAAEPELAFALTSDGPDGADGSHQQLCQEYFAEQLRAAARASGASPLPPFLEPFLMGGIRQLIFSTLLSSGPEGLEPLGAEVAELLVSIYSETAKKTW